MADSPLQKQSADHLRECRRQKVVPWLLDFKESYWFASPHRQRQMTSGTSQPSVPLGDEAELNTSEGYILTTDFTTEIMNAFMPEGQTWCEYGPGMMVPPGLFAQVKDKLKVAEGQINDALKASNLYSELPKAFNPDLAIGTIGLWIDQQRADQPISVLAIPLREIECSLGPDGRVGPRFAIKYTTNQYVRSLLPKEAVIPDNLAREIEKSPYKSTELRFGFWRLWDREDDEWWQHVVLIKDDLVHSAELKGAGCLPFLVGRFNPSADWVWGLGPLIQGLPDLRQVDELERQLLENIELALTPPFSYPSDSWAAIEQGLEPGCGYPIGPDGAKDIKKIYDVPPPDSAKYATESKIHRLRKLFYVDYPEQTGDTPPTLGQWQDEMARAQRRLGTPGTSFWREVPAEIFTRFNYLLAKSGVIEPFVVDGKTIATLPLNPAQRAAEQQELARALQFAQMGAQMFPEEWKATVDGRATLEAFRDKMRVGGLIKFRDKLQVDAFIKQITPLLTGTPPGASGQGKEASAGAPESQVGAPA